MGKGRLDLTIEALVVNKEYRKLFTKKVVEKTK